MTFELRLFDGEDQNLSWSIFGKLPLSHKQWCWWRSWRRWEGGWRWPALPSQEARSLWPLAPYSWVLDNGHEQSPQLVFLPIYIQHSHPRKRIEDHLLLMVLRWENFESWTWTISFSTSWCFSNDYLANQPSGFCLGHNPLTFIFIKLIHAPIVTDKQTVYHFFFKSRP